MYTVFSRVTNVMMMMMMMTDGEYDGDVDDDGFSGDDNGMVMIVIIMMTVMVMVRIMWWLTWTPKTGPRCPWSERRHVQVPTSHSFTRWSLKCQQDTK